MATTHFNNEHKIAVTRLWGGERGICYQISNDADKPEWITLTWSQFQALMTYKIGSSTDHPSTGWTLE